MGDLTKKNVGYYERLHSLNIQPRFIFDYALREKIVRWLLRKNQIALNNSSILDVGFGFGYLSMIFDTSSTIFGVELSHSAVNRFKKELAKAGYKRFSIHQAEISKGVKFSKKFDLVICSHVLEHLENPTKLCSNFKNVVKESGFLLIILPVNEVDHAGLHNEKYGYRKIVSLLKPGFTIVHEEIGSNSMALVEWIRPVKFGNPFYFCAAKAFHVVLSLMPLSILRLIDRLLGYLNIPPKQAVVLLRRK